MTEQINLNPPNTKNLRSILERIWGGKLKHNQTQYTCGTSKCLAGWDLVLNGNYTEDYDISDHQGMIYLANANGSYDPWRWSLNHNNLTDAEAVLLFSPYSSKLLQLLTLSALETGKRLYFECFDIAAQVHYERTVLILLVDTVEGITELTSFLGVKSEEYYIDELDGKADCWSYRLGITLSTNPSCLTNTSLSS